HNGKVERYQRILAEELLYARNFNSEEDRSSAISVWNIHYNYHRRHSGAGGWPPASRLREGVTNVQPSYNYITQESDWNTVAVQMPMGGSDQSMAQARSRCLAQLTRELTRGSGENALRAIVADNNREPELNNRDLKVVNSLRSRGEIARDVSFTHGRMGQEPLLWAADVMSWSVRRNIALDDQRFIQPTLDEGKLTLINAMDGQQLNMKHPQAAAAKTWGPSTLGPDSQLRLGNRESDVASVFMIPSGDDANNSRDFT